MGKKKEKVLYILQYIHNIIKKKYIFFFNETQIVTENSDLQQ